MEIDNFSPCRQRSSLRQPKLRIKKRRPLGELMPQKFNPIFDWPFQKMDPTGREVDVGDYRCW